MLSPSDINYRANIDVLKRAGSPTSVSLLGLRLVQEDLPPGTFVLVDQFVDRTYQARELVLRQGLRRPCLDGASGVAAAARASRRPPPGAEGIAAVRAAPMSAWKRSAVLHAFAESLTYKAQGYSVIGMTNMPEAKTRPRGRDLLRQRGDGDRFRLLASRSRCRHRTGHHSRAELECRARPRRWSHASPRDFPREHEPCPVGSDKRARHRIDHGAGGARSGAAQASSMRWPDGCCAVMKVDGRHFRSIWLEPDGWSVGAIDQRRLAA